MIRKGGASLVTSRELGHGLQTLALAAVTPPRVSERVQLTVVITLLAFGFVGTVLFFLFDLRLPPLLIAVFLGTAVASLVFTFLGGIPAETELKVGQIRFGGTLAALIGCVLVFNPILERQILPDLTSLFSPPPSEWFATSNRTAAPIVVEVPPLGETLPEPARDILKSASLSARLTNGHLNVYPASDSLFVLGAVSSNELRDAGLFSGLGGQVEPFVVTERLAVGATADISPFALILRTGNYQNEHSPFTLVDASGDTVCCSSIRQRGAVLIPDESGYLMVAVVEVNHRPGAEQFPYAKFAVGHVSLAAAAAS